MNTISLRISGIIATVCMCFAVNAGATAYDFSTFSTEGQSYEGVNVGGMTLSSQVGDLHYTNGYGGGIMAGYGATSDVYLDFSTAINGISFRAGDGAGDEDAFGFSAYEFGTGILLGTWYSPKFGGLNEPEWYTLSISALNIGRIVFDPCNSGLCPGSNAGIGGVVITDINTNTIAAPVPEPETYAMLLTGLGLMGFAARRRKQGY